METSELVNYLLTPAAQVLVIIALAELVKRLELFDSKYIPLLDVGLGMVSGIIVFGIMQGLGIMTGILLGVAIGLMACGLFSGVKNVTA